MAPPKVARGAPASNQLLVFRAVRELCGCVAVPFPVGTCHDPRAARREAVPGDTWPLVTRVRSLKALGAGGMATGSPVRHCRSGDGVEFCN